MELSERLEVMKDMVWQVNTYQDLLEFFSYDLHKSQNSISQNEGLFLIWQSLMELQILTLSKLIKHDEKFSIQKLINIAVNKKIFKKTDFQADFDSIRNEYVNSKLDSVRDKFIAHLDKYDAEIKTDINTLCILKNMITSIFDRLSIVIGGEAYLHDNKCLMSIKNLFVKLDEYERISLLLMAAKFKGREQILISEIFDINPNRNSEVE